MPLLARINACYLYDRIMSPRVIIVILALLAMPLGACAPTTTIRVPATELPALSTGELQHATKWPDVYTVDGQPWRVKGSIEHVRIQTGLDVADVTPPFTARIEDEHLAVFSSNRRRAFPLGNIADVSVSYNDAKQTRKRAGIVMISLGGSLLFWLAPVAILSLQSTTPEPFSTKGVVGAALATHLVLTISGIYLASTDPTPPGRWTAVSRPKLQLVPGGAAVSASF